MPDRLLAALLNHQQAGDAGIAATSWLLTAMVKISAAGAVRAENPGLGGWRTQPYHQQLPPLSLMSLLFRWLYRFCSRSSWAMEDSQKKMMQMKEKVKRATQQQQEPEGPGPEAGTG